MSNTRTALTARTSSRYQEFPPPPSLSDRLVCTWTQNIRGVDGEYHPHPVLPDGCVDVVWIGGAAPVVAGPATHRIVVKLSAGTSLIGIRFRPGCAASSLGLPVNELLNQDVPLADIWPHHAKRLTDETFDQQSESTRLRNITTALANRLAVAPYPDPAVQVAIPWLVRHPARRVRDLALSIGINLACGAGYADQAHMCREFRELADTTPQSLLTRVGSTLAMSDLFNTEDSGGD